MRLVPTVGKWHAIGMDIKMGPSFDILTNAGFLQHLYQVCRLDRNGAGFLAAPVCSTFVVVTLFFFYSSRAFETWGLKNQLLV